MLWKEYLKYPGVWKKFPKDVTFPFKFRTA